MAITYKQGNELQKEIERLFWDHEQEICNCSFDKVATLVVKLLAEKNYD